MCIYRAMLLLYMMEHSDRIRREVNEQNEI